MDIFQSPLHDADLWSGFPLEALGPDGDPDWLSMFETPELCPYVSIAWSNAKSLAFQRTKSTWGRSSGNSTERRSGKFRALRSNACPQTEPKRNSVGTRGRRFWDLCNKYLQPDLVVTETEMVCDQSICNITNSNHRKRNNGGKPISGNNNTGRRGKLKCAPCRRRKGKVIPWLYLLFDC